MVLVDQPPAPPGATRPASRSASTAVALVLAAFSLRPALAGVGALLVQVQSGLGMSATLAGLLTAIPSACFAVVGLCVPRASRRHGPGVVVGLAMGVVTLGLLARAIVGDTAAFLLCSGAAVAGIGAANVALPVAVRQYFPGRVGLMTGLYSTSLTAGAALSAAVSVPLAGESGRHWRFALGVWAVPALAASIAWLAVLARDRRAPAPAAPPTASDHGGVTALLYSRTAWALSIFFGLQAAGAYVVLGWLPKILQDAGVGAGPAGLLLALTPTIGIPLAFVVPTVAARCPGQGMLVCVLGATGLLGYLGLWFAPATTPWLWALLLGASQAAFPLALTMIGLRGATAAAVARLSAFVQGVGYLIATPCPLLVGVLHQHTQGWGAPIALMVALLVPQTIFGVIAGRRGTVAASPRTR